MLEAIIAKLRREGCYLDEAGSTPASLCFYNEKLKYTFFVPKPQEGEGIPEIVMAVLHKELEWMEIELLPLDVYLN